MKMSLINMDISEHDPKEDEAYEAELKRLGWCLSCQGYGQDWGTGGDCDDCNGTGQSGTIPTQ